MPSFTYQFIKFFFSMLNVWKITELLFTKTIEQEKKILFAYKRTNTDTF